MDTSRAVSRRAVEGTARKIVKAARLIGAPIPGAATAIDIAELFGII